MKKSGFIMAVTFLACITLAGGSAAASGEQLKIGCLFPFSGDLARLGIDSFQGAELARIVQNENGGVGGKQIVFVKGDAVTPQTAVTEAERLITKEGVDIILGSYSSSISYVASEVAEKYGKVYWELGAISNKITERGFKYLFRTCPRSAWYAQWAAQVARGGVCDKLGLDHKKVKIAGIFEDSLMGSSLAEDVDGLLKDVGLKLDVKEFYNRKAVDLSPMILRLRMAKPDILLGSNYLTDLILFWRQCKELNFNVKAFIGLGGGASMGDFQKALGNDVAGLMDTSFCPPSDAVNPAYAPGVSELMEKYKQVFGHEITSAYPTVNYMGTMVLWQVLEKAGSTKAEDVRRAALSIDIPNQQTVTGYGVKFDETGQNTRARLVTVQWQDGKLWTVWPAEAAVKGKEIIVPLPTWKERKASS